MKMTMTELGELGDGPKVPVAKMREAFWLVYGPSDAFLQVFGEAYAEMIFGPNWRDLKDELDRKRGEVNES
jgi:hypothetical protein